MDREVTGGYPNVHPTFTGGSPEVHPRSSVGSHQGALAGPRWRPSRPTLDGGSPPNVFFFFGGGEVLALFFRPIGATVDLEKC